MMGKVLFFAGYFGAIGYGVAKLGIDKKVAELVRAGYTDIVSYTKSVEPMIITYADTVKAKPELVQGELPLDA